MHYKFNAYGHPNILATHKTTLEFTKDKEVSLRGDCIIGINSDFDLGKLKDFIKKTIKNYNKKIIITIKTIPKPTKIKDFWGTSKIKDFAVQKIQKFSRTENLKNFLVNKKIQETITAEVNPHFNSNKEFVVRKTNFVSERTFAISSNKAAFELNRKLINFLKEKKNRISIIIENKQ